MTTSQRTRITAIPCGTNAKGEPISTRYPYTIDRDPEDWGNNRSRVFTENRTFRAPRGGFLFTPVVVRTDSIEYEAEKTAKALAQATGSSKVTYTVERRNADGVLETLETSTYER